MKQQITVEYDSPVKVVTGMILWAIESAERKTLRTECPAHDNPELREVFP